ncbi:helix-turn-helix domain-containing protein [Streptomyces sp. NPDC006658]|uniref:helix-turn-helix domain-containing protein n=1 Tax=Streptomyces sp. NPDC006658 TaxID=3156900 RepID=UPI0033EDDE43
MTTASKTRGSDSVSARRIRARHLADQGKSLREIAGELGVSKDTVSRDLAAMRRDETPDATPDSGSATDPAPRLILPLSRYMADDLAVLAEAGHSEQEAVRLALAMLANAYRRAWLRGIAPRGQRPRIVVREQGEGTRGH